ncbi:MAG: zinc metalloprotease HtpX [Actinomycetota bacterium]
MTPGINRVKTWALIAAMGGLFVLVGDWLGMITGAGPSTGAMIGLVLGFGFNFAMYWWSGSIAVKSTRSHPVTEEEYPQLYRIVRELTQAQSLPMPQIYVSDMMQPNAFATGRNPQNAKVAVTKGILQILDERELRGVLAHELSHVANRDILVGSVAAAIAMSLTFLVRFGLFFGNDRNSNSGLLTLAAWILAPLAAAMIQMAVSRSREYQADESGAFLSKDPEALASALRKLETATKQVPAPASLTPAEAHLFIMNPLAGRRGGSGFGNMFSTHPPTPERIARLDAISQRLRGGSPIG